MIERIAAVKLKQLASQYRVVTVIGPRQAGKSTLCRLAFPHKQVVNLEAPDVLELASQDPRSFFQAYPDGCIIDEVQRCPTLLSYIQTIVDEREQPGQFILTGSHQLLLMDQVSQSLAGRTAILKLLPLASDELKQLDAGLDLNQVLFRGAYPEIVNKTLNPTEAYSYYVQTYLERDVRQLQAIRDLSMFQNLLRLLAGRSGSILNMASLSSDLGVSEGTIKNWISVAEASFAVFRLKPYYRKLSRQMVKSPKLYFYDTGLLCYLLGIRSAEQLATHPLRGSVFETYVVSECVKFLWNRARETNFYFFADKVLEIDLLVETAEGLVPIEVKSAATFHTDLTKRLKQATNRITELKAQRLLVYGGEKSFASDGVEVVSVKELSPVGNLLLS